MALSEGDIAPDFTLLDSNERPITLSKDLAGRGVVLLFYPKDFDQDCTLGAKGFQEVYEYFNGKGYEVLGISPEPPEKHREFIQNHQLAFEFLSDNGRTCEDYRVKLPFLKLSNRTTYVLDEGHRIFKVHQAFGTGCSHVEVAKGILG